MILCVYLSIVLVASSLQLAHSRVTFHVCDQKVENFTFQWLQLWCVTESFIEQYTDDGQHIYNFTYFVWNSIVGIPLDAIFCMATFVIFWCNVCDIFDINHVLTHEWTEKLHNFCFGNTSQVPNWWFKKSYLCGQIKKLIFPEIKKGFTLPGMGQLCICIFFRQG